MPHNYAVRCPKPLLHRARARAQTRKDACWALSNVAAGSQDQIQRVLGLARRQNTRREPTRGLNPRPHTLPATTSPAQVRPCEFANSKTWYENKQVFGIRSCHKLAHFRTRFCFLKASLWNQVMPQMRSFSYQALQLVNSKVLT